jgi:pilus assembly protein CpaC
MQKNRTNTELIVIVTPELVAPIPAGQPVPDLKIPTKFLPPNSGIAMHQPDEKPATLPPAPTTMPVEKLVESMKPEKPLVIEGASGNFGSASTGAQSSAGASAAH